MGEEKQIIFIGALENKTLDNSTGGVFTACTTLLDGLRKEGTQVVGLNTTYRMKSMRTGINPLRKLFVLISRNIQFVFQIVFNLKSDSVLVFISAGNSYIDKLPSLLVAKLCGKQIIVFPRSGFLLRDYENPFHKPFINLTFRIAHKVICQSGFWKDYFLEKGISSTKLKVVENWYPTEQITLSKRLSFNKHVLPDVLEIVFLSRVEKAKGIDDLILASELLDKKGIKHSISIYGEGEYVSELISRVEGKGLEHIKFKGWLNGKDKLKVLNGYDLAVFTSRFEGYPNSLLDFIFSKIPVIAADIGSVKAVGGDYMTYYLPGASSELAETILEVNGNYQDYIKKAECLYLEKAENNNITAAARKILESLKPN